MSILSAFKKQKATISPKAALDKRIEKSHAKKILRDKFRQKIAKERGVNWKRVRITNWQTKEFIIK